MEKESGMGYLPMYVFRYLLRGGEISMSGGCWVGHVWSFDKKGGFIKKEKEEKRKEIEKMKGREG